MDSPFILYALVVLVAAALAGLVSVGLELLWTRALSARFLSTVYSFGAILVAYLLCLGVGSLAVAVLDRRRLVTRATAAVVLVALIAVEWEVGLLVLISLYVLTGFVLGTFRLVTTGRFEKRPPDEPPEVPRGESLN